MFGQGTTTKEIYNILGKPIVDKVMEGFNGKETALRIYNVKILKICRAMKN